MLQLRFVGIEKPPVWLVDETYRLGSGAGCQIHLPDNSVRSLHALLSVRDEKLSIAPEAEDALVMVDGKRIFGPTYLVHNALVQIGECRLRIVDPKRERPVVNQVEAPVPSASAWLLQSKTTALANKLFPVEKDMVVGRARECDLSLGVAHLSRRHARLFFDSGALWVEDLASANGTFVNGQRVDRARLRAGDELAFDTLTFIVRGEQTETPESADDKTSLRPALGAAPSAAQIPRKAEISIGEIPSRPSKPQRQTQTISRSDSQHSHENAGLLWAGIAAALILTTAAIFYFAT